jgi:hypothetical protein
MNDDIHARDLAGQLEDALRAASLRRVPDSLAVPPFPVALTIESPPRSRRRRWLVPATVAAAVAIVVGVTAGVGAWSHHSTPASIATPAWVASAATTPTHSSGPASALGACPSDYDGSGSVPWVPRSPAGIEGSDRLVPEDTPTSAVICAYVNPASITSDPGGPLSGTRTLTSGLSTLAVDLAWSPRLLPDQGIGCAGVGLTPEPGYLLGLTYPTGTEWVSSAITGGCPSSSNGVFVTPTNIAYQVQASYAAGTWVSVPFNPKMADADACQPLSGRLGQETTLVPAGAQTVKICRSSRGGKQVGVTLTSGFEPLLRALDALPTRTSTGGCQGDGHQNVY